MGPDWILRDSVPFCNKSYIICQSKLEYNHRSMKKNVVVTLTKGTRHNMWTTLGLDWSLP